jgi:hypothetical protein
LKILFGLAVVQKDQKPDYFTGLNNRKGTTPDILSCRFDEISGLGWEEMLNDQYEYSAVIRLPFQIG